MPGLIGFTDKHHHYNRSMLLKMRGLLKHFDHYTDEELYFDGNIYASRTHLGILQQGKQPYIIDDHIFSWLEGEFYNQEELISKYDVISDTDNELLSRIYHTTKSFDFLKDVDGYYAAVLYDKQVHQIHLITDRYGFKPLYWGKINNDLFWSSEVKGFLGSPYFTPVIDPQAVKDFFDAGYLLENRTWFEGVELVPSATVLTFDMTSSIINIHPYWSFSEIIPLKGPIDEREIIKELGRLFKDAVRQRVHPHERIGISLSGGLDSRAIVAAFPEDYSPLHTITFGQEGCDDIKIARNVSKIKGTEHHIFALNSDSWLMPRISGVWRSDGALNILHMHMVEFYDRYKAYMDFYLEGLWGDVLGGLYLKIAPDRPEWHTAQNRGRRFINQDLILGESWVLTRKPFTSNALVDLGFSLPKRIKHNSYIYNKMLLHTFPEYYKNIPWQKTSCPISYPEIYVKLITFKHRVIRRLKRQFPRFSSYFPDSSEYTNYPLWIRQELARSFFEKMLLDKNALYPKYIDRHSIHTFVNQHMNGKKTYHHELCLALTFELWLQQVFEKRYRTSMEE